VQELFRYQTTLLGNKRSAPVIIKGSREWIERYMPMKEFAETFGGYISFRPPDVPSVMMEGEGLGVWGKRNISRLTRMLRERGAEFEVVDDEGPKQDVWVRCG
jgi:hypothetical protein